MRGCSWSLQPPAHAISLPAHFSTLKMEAIYSSETSVNARYTQRHVIERDNFQINLFSTDVLHEHYVAISIKYITTCIASSQRSIAAYLLVANISVAVTEGIMNYSLNE
jgi:hypothetical protein